MMLENPLTCRPELTAADYEKLVRSWYQLPLQGSPVVRMVPFPDDERIRSAFDALHDVLRSGRP